MAIFSAAAAIFTAVSTWIGGLSAIGAFALKTVVGIGLSLAAQALAGKPKQQKQTFSLSTSLQGGGDLSRSFIIGRAATGGSLVWINTWGRDGKSPNAWLTQVIALSDLPVRGLVELWVDGQKVGWNPPRNNETIYGQPIEEFNKDGVNLYVKFYDGTQTDADPALLTIDSTSEREWKTNRVGDGVSYVIVRARATKNMFSGIPRCVFVVDGIKLYDPTKDGTNGGVGDMRYSDQSTWGGDGDDLPAVQLYNLMRGIYYKGNWIYGFQRMPAGRLDGTWNTAIEKCRLQVLGASGMEPQYRSGGEIVISAPISEAIDTLLTACQGEVAEAGGIYSLRVGEPEAPLFSITDDDIISTDEQRFTPFFGLADSINGITGTYPEPLENWAAKSAPPIYRPDLEALDGNRRLLANVEFTFVPYAEQVQRLMKSALLSAMRTRRHTLTLPPKFWRYCVPGDTLRWTSERNGYVNKLFIIKGVIDRANLDCVIDILEWEPNDYAWSSSAEFQPPVIGSLGPIIPPAQPILDWNAVPYIIRDQLTNARRPAIRLTWDNDPDALIGVRAVEWEVRIVGQTELVTTGSSDQPERGSAIISAGIIPDTQYEARGRFIPDDDSRETEWSAWIPLRTDDVKLGAGDIEVDLGVIGDDAKSIWVSLGRQLDDLWKRIEHLGQAEQLEGAVSQIARQRIVAELGESKAEIQRVERVSANGTQAVAELVETVTARVADNEAAIVTESTARADQDSALASQINAVRAEIDNAFADGAIRFEARASSGDVSARYALLLRAGLDGDYLESGLFLEIYTEGGVLRSRMNVVAQQFSIAAGTSARPIFAVIDDEIYMVNVKIQQAQIENLLVGTSNIIPGAVSMIAQGFNNGASPVTVTVNHGPGSPNCIAFFNLAGGGNNALTGSCQWSATVDNDGANLGSCSLSNNAQAPSGAMSTMSIGFYTPPPGRETTTFRFSQTFNQAISTGTIATKMVVMVQKR